MTWEIAQTDAAAEAQGWIKQALANLFVPVLINLSSMFFSKQELLGTDMWHTG